MPVRAVAGGEGEDERADRGEEGDVGIVGIGAVAGVARRRGVRSDTASLSWMTTASGGRGRGVGGEGDAARDGDSVGEEGTEGFAFSRSTYEVDISVTVCRIRSYTLIGALTFDKEYS